MQHLIDCCGLENGCCDAYAGGQEQRLSWYYKNNYMYHNSTGQFLI